MRNSEKQTQQTQLRPKIYISSIDSKLGYHLVECLRDDHHILHGYSYIVGSHACQAQRMDFPHHSIHKVLDYETQKTLLAKCVMESDIVVIPLVEREASHEVEFVLELLREKKKEVGKWPTLVLGIGSHMTWAFSKGRTIQFSSNADKQAQISKILELQTQPLLKSVQFHSKRVPHNLFTWHHEQELKMLSLSDSPNFSTSIFTVGLLYGKDFPSPQLSSILAQSLSLQPVKLYGDGSNYLPLTYVDDLIENVVERVAEFKGRKGNEDNRSHVQICCSGEKITQLEIVEAFMRQTGSDNRSRVKCTGLKYLSVQQAILSTSVLLQSSTKTSSKYPEFQSCLTKNIEQAHQYLQLQPIRIYYHPKSLESPENSGKSLTQQVAGSALGKQLPNNDINSQHEQVVEELKRLCEFNGFSVISEEDFNEDVSEEGEEKHEQQGKEDDEIRMKKEIRFFQRNSLRNCLILFNDQQISEQTLTKYQVIKFIPFQNNNSFQEQKLKLISSLNLKRPEQSQEMNKGPSGFQEPQQTIISNDDENEALREMNPDVNNQKVLFDGSSRDVDNRVKNEKNQRISQEFPSTSTIMLEKQNQSSKSECSAGTEWVKNMDQYMLDNVLVYVSEAYLKLHAETGSKGKPKLSSFIEKLKEIYRREKAIKEQEIVLPY